MQILYSLFAFCYNGNVSKIRLTVTQKVGERMLTNEKEYNGNLFDQLSILEEIEDVATETNATEVLKTVE